MNLLITFGGAAYDSIISKTSQWCHEYGHGQAYWVYDDRWLLGHDFYRLNRWLWETNATHGFGFCSWKTLILMDALSKLAPGDKVLYLDADTYPISDFRLLFDMPFPLMFEAQGCANDMFIRRDCFIAMGMDREDAHAGQHACGRFVGFEKGPWITQQILSEWLAYSINPMCTTHRGESKYGPELPRFMRNSAEQSVLTLLAIKYGIPLHREACQNGAIGQGLPSDTYPQLFFQEWREGDTSNLSGSQFFNVPGETR